MKLYHSTASPNSRRVRMFIAEKAISIPLQSVNLGAFLKELAAGSLPAVQTPPGGTVILDNFSSNPAPKYNGLSAGSTDTRWGVWGNASGSYLQNNNPAFAFKGPSVVASPARSWSAGSAAGRASARASTSA